MLGRHFTIDHILFEERESIAKSSACGFRDDSQSFFFRLYFLGFTDVFKSTDDILESDFSEIEAKRT